MERRECLLWLNSIGVNHRQMKNLDQYFPVLSDVLNGNTEDLKRCGIRSQKIQSQITRKDMESFEHYKKEMTKLGIDFMTYDDAYFPDHLKDIPDPPLILYYMGDRHCLNRNSIGMVGARKATPVGRHIARDLGRDLAKNQYVVVSGMAYGIDTEAHRGAVESKGLTVAVLGCGLDQNYPSHNRSLKKDLLSLGGAIISEFPVGTAPLARNFPQRNRIISGLSKGVIVVEAGLKSGSLITVDYALEQNRDVFSVPGSVLSSVSEGTNQLIKDGAVPITEAKDVLHYYGLEEECNEENTKSFDHLSEIEKKVCVWIMKHQPIHTDEIHLGTRIPMSDLLPVLTILEIKNEVEKLNNRFILQK